MSGPRYEVEPRPANLGGGWRLHLISVDPETGEDVFMGGGVFPVLEAEDGEAMYAEAADAGREWLESLRFNEEWRDVVVDSWPGRGSGLGSEAFR